MIAPLRRRHRLMTAALLVALPMLLVLALGARTPVPTVASLPVALAAGPDPRGADVETRDVFGDLDVTVRSWWTAAGTVIAITPAEPLARPGVLVYWTASPAVDRLPDDAVLLGALADRGRTYAVPNAVASRDGYLVLYSLGHQEVVASGALSALGGLR